jgi:hypothetical protein
MDELSETTDDDEWRRKHIPSTKGRRSIGN